MNTTTSISSTIAFFFLLLSSATCFNITRILDQNPDFSTFNSYLTQTQLAQQINSRNTITILAVDNGSISSISSRPIDQIKKILSVHVVLDYYDVAKLHQLSKKSSLLTTLFQTTGLAAGQQGFLNVTDLKTGEVGFGSAVHGSGLTANLVKTVAAVPYNISVLQVSSVVVPQGIDNAKSPPAPAPAAATPKKAPAPSKSSAPVPTPAQAPSKPVAPVMAPAADTPAPSEDNVSDSPSESPVASAPLANGATADSPVEEAAAPGPDMDSNVSSGARIVFGTCLGVFMGVVYLVAL